MLDEREYVIAAIGTLLNGSTTVADWEEFTARSLRNAQLDGIRRRAAMVDVRLDMKGEAILRQLLDEAEHMSHYDPSKPRTWRMEYGLFVGFAIGAILWWYRYLPGGGLLQNLHLVIVPAALGILIVALRNRREKVGYFDPDIIAQNKRGRV